MPVHHIFYGVSETKNWMHGDAKVDWTLKQLSLKLFSMHMLKENFFKMVDGRCYGGQP